MPDLVSNNLVFRILLDEANLRRLLPEIYFLQGLPPKKDPPFPLAVRGEDRFQVPQQGAFPTTRLPAEQEKFPLLHGETQIS